MTEKKNGFLVKMELIKPALPIVSKFRNFKPYTITLLSFKPQTANFLLIFLSNCLLVLYL